MYDRVGDLLPCLFGGLMLLNIDDDCTDASDKRSEVSEYRDVWGASRSSYFSGRSCRRARDAFERLDKSDCLDGLTRFFLMIPFCEIDTLDRDKLD